MERDILHIDTDGHSMVVFVMQPKRRTIAVLEGNSPFTRRMAALIAANYSDATGTAIDDASLSVSVREHLRRVEQDNPDLTVTYRLNLGEPQ